MTESPPPIQSNTPKNRNSPLSSEDYGLSEGTPLVCHFALDSASRKWRQMAEFLARATVRVSILRAIKSKRFWAILRFSTGCSTHCQMLRDSRVLRNGRSQTGLADR